MGDKLKIVRRQGFSVIPNTVVQDPRLNLATKGLFCLMYSLPDDWDFSVSGLAAYAGGQHGTGRAAITAGLKKLEEAGYMLREQRHDAEGHFAGNTWVLYDECTSPLAGFPSTEKPSTENLQQQNNNKQNIYPPIVPQGGRSSRASKRRSKPPEPKETADWQPARFEGLWSYYPHDKRGNRQKAIAMWDKLHPSDELISEIGRCLKRLMASDEWKAGVAIPHVSTFLNPSNERWKDAYNLDGGGGSSAPPRPQEGVVWR